MVWSHENENGGMNLSSIQSDFEQLFAKVEQLFY